MSASPRRIGADQLGDVGALVLVVGVGVDDHVGAELEPGVEPGLEGRGQALVVGQADDVVDAVARGRPRSCASVEPSSMISHSTASKPSTCAGQVAERQRQLLFLVETGDLDDELHEPAARRLGRPRGAPRPAGHLAGCALGHTVAGYSAQNMDAATLIRPGLEPPAALPLSPRARRAACGAVARRGRAASARDLHRPGAGAAARWRPSGCGCGGSSRGCPTATTSTRRRTSSRGRSRSSRMTSTRSTFSTRPAYSYLLHIVFELWFGSGDAVARAYATDPTTVFVVARRGGRGAGDGRRSGSPTWPASGCSAAPSGCSPRRSSAFAFLPDLLQPPGAQRRAHAGAGGAVAVRRRGGAAPRARAATT